jgi:hypothetical protein
VTLASGQRVLMRLAERVHHQANASTDRVMQHLCDELNATQTVFPGTELRIVYQQVSASNPRVQEV